MNLDNNYNIVKEFDKWNEIKKTVENKHFIHTKN